MYNFEMSDSRMTKYYYTQPDVSNEYTLDMVEVNIDIRAHE